MEVTAVDSSARAVARIEAHAKSNGADIRAIESDTFRFLETATPRSYDLVVVDPPKFARARKDLEAAIKGYERLNSLALTSCARGAVLVTCSCSYHISEAALLETLAEAALEAGKTLRVLERRSQAQDHPVLLTVPETLYLKCLMVEAL